MKKTIIILISFLLSFLAYSENQIFASIGVGYKNVNSNYDILSYNFQGLEVQFQPGFFYFPTTESNWGGGISAAYNIGLGKLDFEKTNGTKLLLYSNTESVWYNSKKYYFDEGKKFNYVDISFTPSIYYRKSFFDNLGIILSLGPEYTAQILDYYSVNNPVTINNRTGFTDVSRNQLYLHKFNLDGEFGLYKENFFNHIITFYFKIGSFEYSELTNNKLQLKPCFTIGLKYRIGLFSIETEKERNIRLTYEYEERENQRQLQEENVKRYQEEQNRLYQEEQEKLLNEEQQFQNEFGKKVIRLDSYSYKNPYAFDKNAIYHYVNSLYLHDWMSQGLIVGTLRKSSNLGNDKKFYIYSLPDITKISDCIFDVYMIYIGTSEFTNALGGTVILPTFKVIQHKY